ncbi:YitT family protein [Halanaerobaculum tunisiense]
MKLNKRIIIDYLVITIGSVLTALGLVMFLVPNKIAAGGVSGLATIIYYLFDLPVGKVMLTLNIPLFIAGVKELGTKFGVRTLYGILALSVVTDLLAGEVPIITHKPLLAALYGGGLIGLGLGLVFRAKGTTGGTDLVAQIISKYTSFSSGKSLLLIDFFVIALATVVFDPEQALYALIALFVTSRVIDLVQEGLDIAKATFIISDSAEEIKAKVLEEMDRGVTVLKGEGGFSKADKDILLCTINRSEVSDLKHLVHTIDEDAFVIITEVHEVLGEGFQDKKKEA